MRVGVFEGEGKTERSPADKRHTQIDTTHQSMAEWDREEG